MIRRSPLTTENRYNNAIKKIIMNEENGLDEYLNCLDVVMKLEKLLVDDDKIPTPSFLKSSDFHAPSQFRDVNRFLSIPKEPEHLLFTFSKQYARGAHAFSIIKEADQHGASYTIIQADEGFVSLGERTGTQPYEEKPVNPDDKEIKDQTTKLFKKYGQGKKLTSAQAVDFLSEIQRLRPELDSPEKTYSVTAAPISPRKYERLLKRCDELKLSPPKPIEPTTRPQTTAAILTSIGTTTVSPKKDREQKQVAIDDIQTDKDKAIAAERRFRELQQDERKSFQTQEGKQTDDKIISECNWILAHASKPLNEKTIREVTKLINSVTRAEAFDQAISIKDHGAMSLLNRAIRTGSEQLVTLLLSKGADPNYKDDRYSFATHPSITVYESTTLTEQQKKSMLSLLASHNCQLADPKDYDVSAAIQTHVNTLTGPQNRMRI